jgi:hypothetical protein
VEHATPAVIVLFFLFCALIIGQIHRARRGKPIFLRKIAGLDAVDDAVGRATEMGRPVMFNPGLDGLSPHLFCALSSMKHVVEVAAELDVPVLVPVKDPVAYPLAEEFWKESYAQMGKPGLYKAEECVRYLSSDQAAFGAGTAGWIERERPGANFMFGAYGYESLFIAEAGQKAGAIQVAATHSFYQVPFLMMACDFTAFGEEFFAAGAYFSRDPVQVGSLVGQDYVKLIILILILVGALWSTLIGLGVVGDPEAGNPLALLLNYRW